jgi:hypothetical protein
MTLGREVFPQESGAKSGDTLLHTLQINLSNGEMDQRRGPSDMLLGLFVGDGVKQDEMEGTGAVGNDRPCPNAGWMGVPCISGGQEQELPHFSEP